MHDTEFILVLMPIILGQTSFNFFSQQMMKLNLRVLGMLLSDHGMCTLAACYGKLKELKWLRCPTKVVSRKDCR